MDSKHTSPKDVNFRNGFTGSDIGGFAEQPSGELYARFNWVFSSFCRHTRLVIMEIRSHGHLMKRLLILLENLLTSLPVVTILYTMFWQYIEEGFPMLKPLVYYDQSDIQTHYRNDEFILETKF
jgi:alpha-glucosidase